MRKKLFYFIGGLGVLFLIGSFIFGAPRNFPVGKNFTLEAGSSLRSVSAGLKTEKIIHSRTLFEALVILEGGEKHLASGDYFFEKKLSVFEVARRISLGLFNQELVKITVPEGFDNNQIASLFSSKLNKFNKEKFLLLAKDKEGYLFPDTYFFFAPANEENVLNYLSSNYEKKIKPIRAEISSFGRSEKEIVTMASLVEREAKGENDRTIIAGILWNRINKKMPLQVDAAPETYKTRGLPESPICNPGLKSILAALHPTNSPFLYYLHDQNGGVHYARTFEEHKKNKLKYLK